MQNRIRCLATETIEGSALPLQSIDDVHGSDGLPLGMLGVGDSIANNILQENLENASGLLIDQARDTLDSSTASKTTDGRLGDALDVITQDFAVTLGASLSESLASFASTSHVEFFLSVENRMMGISKYPAFYTQRSSCPLREFESRDMENNIGAKILDPFVGHFNNS